MQRARAERRVIFTQDSDFFRLMLLGILIVASCMPTRNLDWRNHSWFDVAPQVLDADEMEGHVKFL
jgi:hypothetical protein